MSEQPEPDYEEHISTAIAGRKSDGGTIQPFVAFGMAISKAESTGVSMPSGHRILHGCIRKWRGGRDCASVAHYPSPLVFTAWIVFLYPEILLFG